MSLIDRSYNAPVERSRVWMSVLPHWKVKNGWKKKLPNDILKYIVSKKHKKGTKEEHRHILIIWEKPVKFEKACNCFKNIGAFNPVKVNNVDSCIMYFDQE